MTIKARIFGPASPVTGEPAELSIFGHDIEIRTASATHRAVLEDTRIRETGVDLSGLEFSWDAPEGRCAVQVTDAEALRVLRAQPQLSSLTQMTALRSRQRRAGVGRTLGWTAIGVFVALPVLLLLAFIWQADNIAMAVANRIPIEQEAQLGEQAFEHMRSTLKLQNDGPPYQAVQTLGTRLTRGSRYTYRFHMAENKEINAFALPGGIIVVHSGLVQTTRRPEELAGVLAHEIQHVERRHSLQAMIKDLGLRGLWLLVSGDASGVIGQAALQLTSLKFSRDAEAEADRRGFDVLVTNDIDPGGMADFFSTLAQKSADMPEFLSTHPVSADREKRLRELQKTLSGRSFGPLQLGTWPP